MTKQVSDDKDERLKPHIEYAASGNPWGAFLKVRADTVRWLLGGLGETPASVAEMMKMDADQVLLIAMSGATALTPLPECGTCNDDPAVCATVPGLRHCEKAMREAEPRAQTPLEIVEEWKDWLPYPNSTAAEWDRYKLAAYIARSTSGTNWREWRPEPADIANMKVDDALIRLGQVAYERDLLLARINAVSATGTPKP